MLPPNSETRQFFNKQIAKQCGEDKALAESVPHAAFVKAVLSISSRENAELFLAGHLHWLQGKKPRTIEDALAAARGNIFWCFEEKMKPEMVETWTALCGETPAPTTRTPEEAFKTASAVGEKIKAGKDPALVAALAKKLLQKKTGGQ